MREIKTRITDAEIRRAREETIERDKTRPRAQSVSYNQVRKRVVIDLVNGCTLRLPPHLLQGLENATASQLRDARIHANGNDIHWPALDVQFSVEGLVNGIFGTATWMRNAAASMGRKAGQSKSPAKIAAARAKAFTTS